MGIVYIIPSIRRKAGVISGLKQSQSVIEHGVRTLHAIMVSPFFLHLALLNFSTLEAHQKQLPLDHDAAPEF